MGTYVNTGNEGFRRIRNGEYVDKSALISYVNSTIDTYDNMICASRPRRFGKSFAASMLAAYYDRTCDSKELFSDLVIAKSDSFEKYLNQYDVIYLDITRYIAMTTNITSIVSDIQRSIIQELRDIFPEAISEQEASLVKAISDVNNRYGNKFYVIIDEWDALFREAKTDDRVQKDYVRLLRGLFKGGVATAKTIAGAYITGILPIKKYGTQSAMTDFREYSMVDPAFMAEYVGFTEDEVKSLCIRHEMDFDGMRQWYDGYVLRDVGHVYSPNSVMQALKRRAYGNYWTKTESFETLKDYICMNLDGLKDAMIEMLGGNRIRVNPLSFQNDMVSFRSKDDVLTLLVHLGYLAYDEKNRMVYIPNLEVSDSFQLAVQDTGWQEIADALRASDALLDATIAGDTETVAMALEKIHASTSSVLQYNDENSLSCALTIAYYTARREYLVIREFPTGKGFADFAFIPRKNTEKPAMIVELKYDRDTDAAIRQIKEKRYEGELANYTGKLLLVGINYDKASKKHECRIENKE